jgi:hypothetical protein
MGNGCSFPSGEGVVETMTVSLDMVEAAASEAAASFDVVDAEELEAAVESRVSKSSCINHKKTATGPDQGVVATGPVVLVA